MPPLLTHLCNQQPPEASFESGLVKGEFADDTPGFWERLCHKNLAAYCEVGNPSLRPPKALDPPSPYDGDQISSEIAGTVRRALCEALIGNARRLRSGADLGLLPEGDAGVLPLCGEPWPEPLAGAAAVLGALLAPIDETPAEAALWEADRPAAK